MNYRTVEHLLRRNAKGFFFEEPLMGNCLTSRTFDFFLFCYNSNSASRCFLENDVNESRRGK